MDIKKPKNENYAAVVVEIKTLLPLANCDNVQAAIIMGNQVIVSKSVQLGEIGLYFPLETQLSEAYLKHNNLYRKKELNADPTQSGYFEENGRIRCIKFRGMHKSEGLYMPLSSLDDFIDKSDYVGFIEMEYKNPYQGIKIGDTFDELNGVEICRKYVIKTNRTPGKPGTKKDKKKKQYESKLVDNQFRFHQDTSMLYKNIHRIQSDSLLSITYKMHGTSAISSYVLCKRFIPLRERIGSILHNVYTYITSFGKQKFRLLETEYDYLYSSRKVIKNEELNPTAEHFYDANIWEITHNELKDFLQKGMTFYYEVVGFMPSGAAIQKDYDYGCSQAAGEHKNYIYRITYTNQDGKVFEFSAKQVQDFCNKNGLNAVPLLYYGEAKDFVDNFQLTTATNTYGGTNLLCKANTPFDPDAFLERVKLLFNEKDCCMCVNKVPEEGVVVRIEGLDFEAYKQKSNRFYERETKLLDQGVVDIEEEN